MSLLRSVLTRFPTASNFQRVPKVCQNVVIQSKRYLGEALTDGSTTTKSKKVIGYWLLGCAGMVYGAVAIGGLTRLAQIPIKFYSTYLHFRLTESGLSMVNWDLFKTMKPPFSNKDWIEEFEKYKQYPEYKFKGGEEMSLNDFKFIWTMEYLHRMWGRAIGIVFLLPCAYFWAKGRFSPAMKKRMALAGGLLIAQVYRNFRLLLVFITFFSGWNWLVDG